MNPNATIEEVQSLQQPTSDFLCDISANTYGIEFVYFKIRNMDAPQNAQTLFEVAKEEAEIGKPPSQESRTVKYHFGPNFFQLKTIGTTLEFKVGDNPVKDFLMIERHYFKDKLIKSYSFGVPFCIPNTRNSMEAVYDLPQFSAEETQEMISCPYETKSDSFYFVEGKLIMHNKSEYSYAPL